MMDNFASPGTVEKGLPGRSGMPSAVSPASSVPEPPPTGQSVTPRLVVVLVVVLFSGGLFGYDQGVISGALHGIKAAFSLSPLLVEVVTSWVTLGALFGALAAGELADRIGRKRTVLIAGAMFTLGSLVQALAPDTVILVAGRLIVGAGVGVAAVERRRWWRMPRPASMSPHWRRNCNPTAPRGSSLPGASYLGRSTPRARFWSEPGRIPMTALTVTPSWQTLKTHHAQIKDLHLRDLFADDPGRAERFSAEGAGIFLDYSKNRITDETLRLLLRLAEERGVMKTPRCNVCRREDQHHGTPRGVARGVARAARDAHRGRRHRCGAGCPQGTRRSLSRRACAAAPS